MISQRGPQKVSLVEVVLFDTTNIFMLQILRWGLVDLTLSNSYGTLDVKISHRVPLRIRFISNSRWRHFRPLSFQRVLLETETVWLEDLHLEYGSTQQWFPTSSTSSDPHVLPVVFLCWKRSGCSLSQRLRHFLLNCSSKLEWNLVSRHRRLIAPRDPKMFRNSFFTTELSGFVWDGKNGEGGVLSKSEFVNEDIVNRFHP